MIYLYIKLVITLVNLRASGLTNKIAGNATRDA